MKESEVCSFADETIIYIFGKYVKSVALSLEEVLLQLPKRNASPFGNNSVVFKGTILWNTLPDSIKKGKPNSNI